jgi:hypothetical protein
VIDVRSLPAPAPVRRVPQGVWLQLESDAPLAVLQALSQVGKVQINLSESELAMLQGVQPLPVVVMVVPGNTATVSKAITLVIEQCHAALRRPAARWAVRVRQGLLLAVAALAVLALGFVSVVLLY